MASPSTVTTFGYGTWGSVNLLPTLGFGIFVNTLVYGPLRIAAAECFIPGAQSAQCYIPGPQAAECFIPGAVAAETP